MLKLLSRYAKSIALIAGFIFGVIGSLWSFVVVDRLGEEQRQLSNVKADVTRQIQSLNSTASDYFVANQQGDLIFILAQQDSARRDVAGLVYKANLLDRATPVRNMIGALVLAKQLDYRQTYDAYEKLNDETRANFTADNYFKLKEVEKDLIAKGQARVSALLDNQAVIDNAINANEAAQNQNRILGLITSNLGALLLLLANLTAGRSKEVK